VIASTISRREVENRFSKGNQMSIKQLGDVISGIQNQSKSGVTYSVQLSTVNPGMYDVLRNGVRTWSFIFHAVPGGGDLTGAASDSNPTGALIQLVTTDGIPVKADAQAFISSLS
jgi:hypothetical protein